MANCQKVPVLNSSKWLGDEVKDSDAFDTDAEVIVLTLSMVLTSVEKHKKLSKEEEKQSF